MMKLVKCFFIRPHLFKYSHVLVE